MTGLWAAKRACAATIAALRERQLLYWRERLPCKCCQRVRTVKIWEHAGKRYLKEYCEACELLRSARVHERQATAMRAKARGLFEKYGVDVPRI